ncbi:WD repeat-containing protein on Y chromosome [Rhopalosiphum maidis]|uniref:WD repeat-containing protein on Y chromosome n=1 Tax=Rhopalosiphum maidis TaxID=43146 RepID=UPI000F005ACB|nr:WD repeat-containing protein on Y chromosome [Rhopalosiphum maidis]
MNKSGQGKHTFNWCLKHSQTVADISDDESDENIEDIKGKKIYLNNLMKQVNETVLTDIRQSFLKYVKGNIKENQLRDILKPYNIVLSDKNFHAFFSKIDVKKKGTVNFLLFVTYLAEEFEIKRKYNEFVSNAETELSKFIPKLLPNKLIEYGEEGIIRYVDITFLPNKIKQSQKEPDEPEYIAASQSGKIVRYTSDMQWKATYQVVSDVPPTRARGLVAMPEFSVICLSLMGGELMFYDMSSGQFKLCFEVNLGYCVLSTCLIHVYAFNIRQKTGSSKIAIGDEDGTVFVLEFLSSDEWNPFKDKSGKANETKPMYIESLVKQTSAEPPTTKPSAKCPPLIRAYLYEQLHNAPVEQIAFYNAGSSFASVSQSHRQSMAQYHFQPKRNEGPVYTANVEGFTCLCAVHDTHLAAGSLDRSIRVWDIKADRASGPVDCTTLTGHDWGVMRVSYNPANGYLYSVSTECIVKVWDLRRATCLLTFDGLTVAAAPERKQFWPFVVMHFNWRNQAIVCVANDYKSFMVVECTKPTVADRELSGLQDDKSHATPVVKTLYNALFRVLISTSAEDSSISVWNMRTGDVIIKWSMAHTEEVYCEILPVEITAANFDPSGGLLVTAAVNGSVHMWDPNTGVCLNRLRIPSGGRISEVFWLPNKILVTGFDHRVTEFNDPLLLSKGKVWLSNHDEPVLSACVKLPSLFVTTTQAGVMGFWRLETGQLTKKYKARMRPDTRKNKNSNLSSASKSQMTSTMVSKSQISSLSLVGSRIIGDNGDTETREEKLKRLDIKHTPREHYAAVATHFLRARPEDSNVGTLLVATRNGVVQIWCTYKVPKYISQFVAIHIADDYVTSMASDPKSEYLITSFESGYIKTWLVTNFGQPRHTIYDVNMPSLRSRFPFLIIVFFMGRAERAASKNMAGPLLVSTYRAHSQRINHIDFIEKLELIISSSVDKMIRIWTLAGHYVGTLGMTWPDLPKVRPINVTQFKIPLDIRRQASFTTIQILKDGVNASLRSPAVWDKLELLRQQRVTRDKKGKRKLHNKKCPDLPLHDTHIEFLRTKTTSITRPVVIKIDESKPRIKIHKHIPLYDLDTIPVIQKLEKTKEESTRRTKLIVFK